LKFRRNLIRERSIFEVLEKVKCWRRLYEGKQKLNLDVAAERVDIARKSLDDYYI